MYKTRAESVRAVVAIFFSLPVDESRFKSAAVRINLFFNRIVKSERIMQPAKIIFRLITSGAKTRCLRSE